MCWVEKLFGLIAEGSDVLELGCGGGGPATQRLAERNLLVGVDISPRQIERARERVPNATFRCADATALELEPDSFDAIVSLYMLGHVPRAEQAPLLGSIASWLRAGGYLLATLGAANADATRWPTTGWARRCSSPRSTRGRTGGCSPTRVSS
jgi:SAM-dependent methyltransferase